VPAYGWHLVSLTCADISAAPISSSGGSGALLTNAAAAKMRSLDALYTARLWRCAFAARTSSGGRGPGRRSSCRCSRRRREAPAEGGERVSGVGVRAPDGGAGVGVSSDRRGASSRVPAYGWHLLVSLTCHLRQRCTNQQQRRERRPADQAVVASSRGRRLAPGVALRAFAAISALFQLSLLENTSAKRLSSASATRLVGGGLGYVQK
jgi:hypothetical protein